MGDTKRGRERKGKKKREQHIEQEIDATLHADDQPPEPDEEVPDIRETDMENVSVTETDEPTET